MRHGILTRCAPLAIAFLLGGCVSRPPVTDVVPAKRWPAALIAAQQLAGAGRYGAADSTLAAIQRDFPGTSPAAESAYWRALFRLDPANPQASARDAAQTLEAYLASRATLMHAQEAATLRRAAATMDSLSRATDAARTELAAQQQAKDKAAAEELQRTKDELTRTQAELDRIRKRLTGGKP